MSSGLDPIALGMTTRELVSKIRDLKNRQAANYNSLRQTMIERYQEVLRWKSETGSR
jgi:hypothetical protein